MFGKKIPTQVYYLLAIFLVIFLLGLTGIFRPAQSLLEKTLVIPVKQKVYDWQRFSKKELGDCQLKNEKETAELKAKIASLTEENLAQKRLLSAPLPKDWQFLPVAVIEVKDETLTLSLGKRDGIREGMVALLGETYLGRVTLVSEELSQVRLPSFLEEKLLVKIVSSEVEKIVSFPDQVTLGKGLSVGRGQGRIRVEQILSSEGIAKGNLVITNVEGTDLLVGEVEEVIEKKGEVFKSALVKRFYNPEELDTIFLVRGKL